MSKPPIHPQNDKVGRIRHFSGQFAQPHEYQADSVMFGFLLSVAFSLFEKRIGAQTRIERLASRKLLFFEANNPQFADDYAQAVTFGLLMARSSDIRLADGMDQVGRKLGTTNSLIDAALRSLTDEVETGGPHLISVDELRAAGALYVPPAWRKSLGDEERDLFSDLIDDDGEEKGSGTKNNGP